MSAWLDGLNAGDSVAVRRGYGYASYTLATVERTTATQIIIGGMYQKFRRADGYAIGSDRLRIVEATPQVRAVVRRDELLNDLKGRNWDALTDATLEAVVAAFNTPATEG